MFFLKDLILLSYCKLLAKSWKKGGPATETEKERARLLEEERENAVNEAKNAATKAAEASIAEARQEKEEAESIAYETIEAAEEAKAAASATSARFRRRMRVSSSVWGTADFQYIATIPRK